MRELTTFDFFYPRYDGHTGTERQKAAIIKNKMVKSNISPLEEFVY